MHVLLLNPPRFDGIPVIREERCEITERYSVLPPYSLLQIAGILREQGHSVNLIDANGFDLKWSETEELMRELSYDALIFRFTPTTFDDDMRAAHISKQIRPEAHTAAICWTLHTLPRQVMEESPSLDFYIMHEYEAVTPALFEALSGGGGPDGVKGIAYRKNDQTVQNAPAEPIKSYDTLPLPAFDLLPSLEPYHINVPHGKPFTIMYASKGCPFACTFCTVRRTNYKRRSAESILHELRYLKSLFGLRTVSFFDETFTIDKKRVLELCERIQVGNLRIKWYCNTRVELVTKDMLRAMRRGGCRGIAYGIESGSQQILKGVKKGNTVEEAEAAIRSTKEAGIKAYCSFIMGLPGENWDTVRETIRFVKRTRPTGAQFNVAVPYPGTPMYDLAVQKGWTKPSLQSRRLYQHTANMRTESLEEKELERAREMAYRSLYFDPRWIMENVFWVLRYPEDLLLGVRYFFKIMNNYLIHKMRHAH
ncbi:B12-binding domain-containing radical SAM protein [Candidatus Bathyarchaeota archaeon]|nr:B12-binding domain-containing radical SAM protein [Candidatus Bathyarchaeota archaeon]